MERCVLFIEVATYCPVLIKVPLVTGDTMVLPKLQLDVVLIELDFEALRKGYYQPIYFEDCLAYALQFLIGPHVMHHGLALLVLIAVDLTGSFILQVTHSLRFLVILNDIIDGMLFDRQILQADHNGSTVIRIKVVNVNIKAGLIVVFIGWL